MSKIIEAEDLTKIYAGNLTAVDHVSFSVDEGELFGFLGPNGAGKTTTIKMLTTLASITSGKASVAYRDCIKEPNEVRKSIGIVPQDLAVDDDLTGIENVMLSAKLYRVPESIARKRAEELINLVDLRDASKRLVATYSGGMRKRLELIVGLIHQPRIFFLDEPTLGLDIQTRAVIWDYIKRLNKEHNLTIFMTTHYLEEADSLCDSVAIIDHGKIRISGSPSELKEKVGGDVLEIDVTNGASLTEFFRSIQGVKEVKQTGSKYRIKIPRAEEALTTIFEGISAKGLKINEVSLTKPTLDEVFLEVTGRSLRDESSGAEDSFQRMITSRRRL